MVLSPYLFCYIIKVSSLKASQPPAVQLEAILWTAAFAADQSDLYSSALHFFFLTVSVHIMLQLIRFRLSKVKVPYM